MIQIHAIAEIHKCKTYTHRQKQTTHIQRVYYKKQTHIHKHDTHIDILIDMHVLIIYQYTQIFLNNSSYIYTYIIYTTFKYTWRFT